jgi:hypothetical protein
LPNTRKYITVLLNCFDGSFLSVFYDHLKEFDNILASSSEEFMTYEDDEFIYRVVDMLECWHLRPSTKGRGRLRMAIVSVLKACELTGLSKATIYRL